MSYREDCDLEFLSQVKSEDLNDLVHLLIYDKDGLKDSVKSCHFGIPIYGTILIIISIGRILPVSVSVMAQIQS